MFIRRSECGEHRCPGLASAKKIASNFIDRGERKSGNFLTLTGRCALTSFYLIPLRNVYLNCGDARLSTGRRLSFHWRFIGRVGGAANYRWRPSRTSRRPSDAIARAGIEPGLPRSASVTAPGVVFRSHRARERPTRMGDRRTFPPGGGAWRCSSLRD